MKNYLINIIICFIILFLFCGCLNNSDNSNDNNSKYPFYEYKYEVNIQTVDNNNFSLLIPILETIEDGKMSEIMNYLNISGNADIEITDSKYGKCLSINGTGNIKIESKGNKKITYAWLNMYNATYGDEKQYGEYWIYYESFSSNKLNGYIYSWINHAENKYSGQGYCCLINIDNLNSGWNQYKGEHTIKNP